MSLLRRARYVFVVPALPLPYSGRNLLLLYAKFILLLGYCQWGDKCRHLHVENPRQRFSLPSNANPVPRSSGARSSSAASSPRVADDAPYAQNERGVVISVKESFGFVKFSSSGKSVFYHKTNVQSSNQMLREGDEVECDLVTRNGKDEAINVRLLGGLSFLGGAKKTSPQQSPQQEHATSSPSPSLPPLAPQWKKQGSSPALVSGPPKEKSEPSSSSSSPAYEQQKQNKKKLAHCHLLVNRDILFLWILSFSYRFFVFLLLFFFFFFWFFGFLTSGLFFLFQSCKGLCSAIARPAVEIHQNDHLGGLLPCRLAKTARRLSRRRKAQRSVRLWLLALRLERPNRSFHWGLLG